MKGKDISHLLSLTVNLNLNNTRLSLTCTISFSDIKKLSIIFCFKLAGFSNICYISHCHTTAVIPERLVSLCYYWDAVKMFSMNQVYESPLLKKG